MLKNKIRIISLLVLIFLTFGVSFVHADEPQPKETSINLISEQNAKQEEMKKDDVYFIGDTITIDHPVDGNAFIIAKNVTINSQIGGNAFIIAKNINLTDNAYIFSSVFTSSQELNISGTIYDLYSISNTININGLICRDIKVNCNNITINGHIKRNAYINSNTINFVRNDNNEEQNLETAINGNLTYSAKKEINIPDGSVAGEKIFNPIKTNTESIIKTYIFSLGSLLSLVSIVWLIFKWLAPNFINNSIDLLMKPKNILSIIMNGIISPLLVIMGSAILIYIPITTNIGIISIVLFLLLIAISSSTLIILINQIICNKFKIEKNAIVYGILILSTLIYWLLSIIPYIGIIIKAIFTILGLGILTDRLYPNSISKKTK